MNSEIEESKKVFRERILQNALLHQLGKPLDALHVNRFQELGVFKESEPLSLPTDTLDVLSNANHPKRLQLSPGPFIFVQHEKQRSVIEIAPFLLSHDLKLREAALQYFENVYGLQEQVLSPLSIEMLKNHSVDLRSSEVTCWRSAAINVVSIIRDDLLWHIAGLRQSLIAQYEDGFDEYFQLVLRPSLQSLMHLRPPVWNAKEQCDEIKDLIEQYANLPTLDAALTKYFNLCGYLPLSAELGASKLAQLWFERHAESDIGWDEVWTWASNMISPFARYHAVAIALEIPIFRPKESMQPVWEAVVSILDTSHPPDATCKWHNVWALYSILATHYARHVEALHPGIDGDRIACYAWWLAGNVGAILGINNEQAEKSLEELIIPEAQFSLSRWTIARSPVTPSGFRYVTLCTQSAWALSLVVKLIRAFGRLSATGIPPACREKIAKMAGSHLAINPFGAEFELSQPAFAIEEIAPLSHLYKEDEIVTEVGKGVLTELHQFRQSMANIGDFKARLENLLDLNETDQYLTVLFLRIVVFSSDKYDDVISGWLEQSKKMIEVLKLLPMLRMQTLLEALAEFQQRPRLDLPIKLPHMLASAVEQLDDIERVKLLNFHAKLMSINAGIVSPIQRLMTSKWRAEFLAPLRIWRENIIEAGKYSEPWVSARVRATSAAISRLIGPRSGESMPLTEGSDTEEFS